MKRNFLYILIMLLVSCENDATWVHKDIIHQQTITTTRHNALISVGLDDASMAIVRSIAIEYDKSADFSKATRVPMVSKNGKWQAALTDLQEDILYNVRYVLTPAYLPQWDTDTFRTINPLPPLVTTLSATDVTATTAILHGKTTNEDNYDITERGFYYSLLKDDDFERKQVTCSSGEGIFSAEIKALRAAATYYYVAYAVNKNGIAYGDTLTFNTVNPY